ncbi:MAG: exo-beta-N-acetylmuramidase NamZ domain-containing protein [Terriglobia bacterium]
MLAALLLCGRAFAQTFSGAADADAAIDQAIRENKIPGAVLLVGQRGTIVYRKAYGNRSLLPSKQPMTTDTIFDIASLTKVVATTSCLMRLFEQGRLWPDDLVTAYLPEFQGGKSSITVRDLMTHFSGLQPDLKLEPAWSGYETGVRKALIEKPAGPPRVKFVYSDINFILLGEIVRRLSGMPENEFVRKTLFDPLGMSETTYLPRTALRPRIAPTEELPDGTLLHGVVHDPTTRYMGGVAGHAGVFSTADDLAKFCQMLLDGGAGLFSPVTIREFTTAHTPIGQPILRGLGWDIDSPYSGTRGDLFPVGSFGHTGFTGTSIWIDPGSDSYVVLLANAGHPHLRKAITPLRREIATIAAKAAGYQPGQQSARFGRTFTGLDVLVASQFRVLRGKRVGLIANHSSVDRWGRRSVDLMKSAGITVGAIFSPEHGFAGVEDRMNLDDSSDPAAGIRIWSLYGQTLRPTPAMLRGIDALVFDIQDVGVRFYTYESTMLYAMEEAARARIPFYVLDRPNPLNGVAVEGPMLDPANISFVGAFPLPLRHGLTMGELAELENAERHLNADLHVIRMAGWDRREWFDDTAMAWVNPSPNIRNTVEELLYPGVALLEYSTNYSVGRGTDSPFEQIGADWINGPELARYLNSRQIPGVVCRPVTFTPASSNFSGKQIPGVRFEITDRAVFDSSRLGLEIAQALQKLYPGRIKWEANKKLIGSDAVIKALAEGSDPLVPARAGVDSFITTRANYLLYR